MADKLNEEVVNRAFGGENRARLLAEYFRGVDAINSENAWTHVYRLLLWIDRTTGLAHCYESDKAQPGRHWYLRTMRFHGWVARQLGVTPIDLSDEIDWLFRRATHDMSAAITIKRRSQETTPTLDGMEFPAPGQDPELIEMIEEELEQWLPREPPREVMQVLSEKIHEHIRSENKRRNLIGEGFEDVLSAVMRHCSGSFGLEVLNRPLLHDIHGFHEPPYGEKPRKVDLAVVSGPEGRRTLVSCKWSIRADREEQFASDFESYARLERAGEAFEYVLVTNEFDAARLVAAADRRHLSRPLFDTVVHVAPQALLAAYDDATHRSFGKVKERLGDGKIVGLGEWLRSYAV